LLLIPNLALCPEAHPHRLSSRPSDRQQARGGISSGNAVVHAESDPESAPDSDLTPRNPTPATNRRSVFGPLGNGEINSKNLRRSRTNTFGVTRHFDYTEITFTDPGADAGSDDDLTRTVGVLDSITVPVFEPELGGTTVSTEEIAWNTSQISFEQINGTPEDTFPFIAVHLDSVVYPTGENFQFDRELSPPYLPLSRVDLPSGATVDYTSELAWPVGSLHFAKSPTSGDRAGDEIYRCGAGIPVPLDVPNTFTTTQMTLGVVKRTMTYHDASTFSSGNPRQETTHFSQGLACPAVPTLNPGPSGIDKERWPYDFQHALRDDETLYFDSETQESYPQDTGYLWTVVSTQTGDGVTARNPNFPEFLADAVTIHRFHPLTREEFSIDVIAGTGAEGSPLAAIVHPTARTGYWEFFLSSDSNLDIRVIRHTEIERSVLAGFQDVKDFGLDGDRYTYVSRKTVFTDETVDSTVADIKSDSPCYASVPLSVDEDPPAPSSPTCTRVDTLTTVDDYLNPLTVRTFSVDSASGLEVDRTETMTYDPSTDDWALSRKISSVLTDASSPTSTETGWTWTDLSPTGGRPFWVAGSRIFNPDPNGECTADCVETTYGYDDLGNPDTQTLSGGSGAAFGYYEFTTETLWSHGSPSKKSLTYSADEDTVFRLLLWQREIDPSTGLPRWHVGDDGFGRAYLYDDLGRITDIAPVDGFYSSDPPSEGIPSWYFSFAATGSGDPVVGTHIVYDEPSLTTLLRHRVFDATWGTGPLTGALGPPDLQLLPGGIPQRDHRTRTNEEGLRRRRHGQRPQGGLWRLPGHHRHPPPRLR